MCREVTLQRYFYNIGSIISLIWANRVLVNSTNIKPGRMFILLELTVKFFILIFEKNR